MGRNGIETRTDGRRVLPGGEVIAEYVDYEPDVTDDKGRVLVLVAIHLRHDTEYAVGWLPDGQSEWVQGFHTRVYATAMARFFTMARDAFRSRA